MNPAYQMRTLLGAFAVFALLLSPTIVTATPCTVPDAGTGTVVMPPPNCPYVSPTDFHLIVAGLPPGDTIKVGVEHSRFLNPSSVPDGAGETETFGSTLKLTMTGTGGLSSFNRLIMLPANCQSHTDPRTPGQPVQSFDTEMKGIQGQLPPGDPDFDLLRITAGSGFGMPSPGHTTLTLVEGNNWNVESFFDISYKIEFVGHPGSILGGHSGSTTGTIRMGTGQPAPPPPAPCTVVDNGTGTVDLPPQGCGYVSPADLHMMIDQLAPGTTITVAAQHSDFFNIQHIPGGPLGGEDEDFHSAVLMQLHGTGDLAGYQSFKSIQVACRASTAPRTPGNNIQSFDTQMTAMQGQIVGDPDFDLLRITAGNGFNLPSPGHTTLTRVPDQPGQPPRWNIDSFFDITYRIDWHGRPGGPIGGHSGSTTGTIRMQSGSPTVTGVPVRPSAKSVELVNNPNPFTEGATIKYRLPAPALVKLDVYDASGKLVRNLANERTPAGPHAMLWDGRDNQGQKVGSGIFFIKLAVDGKLLASKKAVLVK